MAFFVAACGTIFLHILIKLRLLMDQFDGLTFLTNSHKTNASRKLLSTNRHGSPWPFHELPKNNLKERHDEACHTNKVKPRN